MHTAPLNRISIAAVPILLVFLAAMPCTAVQSPLGEKYSKDLSMALKSAQPAEKIPVIVILENSTYAGKVLQPDKVKKTYEIINAASADLTRQEIEELGGKQGISKIFLDRVKRLSPIESIDQNTPAQASLMSVNLDAIGATYVQNNLNYTGRGVTIAIVDTGIDYTHPDLGGCLGAGCKVIGGYNFVEDSADPMDDDGHGTHCAGIAAANGGIKGVAPDANLLAVKVCDPEGCQDSDTIAGIDWAMGHGANVISLSLGSNVQPSDGFGPVEMACDAAVARGVVVVAAAGNEGPGSGTLADAASALDVIGVGADDTSGTASARDDHVAGFSCRGPASFGRFKPEIVAPGTGIVSTKLGGGYSTKQGTSMATPHVAGAAALLLEKYMSATPKEIKSLIVRSAENISGNAYAKGAGLINVTRAVTTQNGAWINGRAVWEESVPAGMSTSAILKIKNDGTGQADYSISLDRLTDPNEEYTISASLLEYPAAVSLASGEEKEIRINFSSQGVPPETYGGALVLRSATDNIRIPISLTIPLSGTGILSGYVDDACSIDSPDSCGYNPSGGVGEWGDWVFYKLSNVNGTTLDLTLNWSGAENDLDLYVFSPGGQLVGIGGEGNTSGEHVETGDLDYPEYWVAVYAYAIDGALLYYNLSVQYGSSLNVAPSLWQGGIVKGEKASINFTVSNDAFADSGITAQVLDMKNAEGKLQSGSISRTGSDTYTVVWKKSTSGFNLADANYLNATLTWSNPSNDLDMIFLYKNGIVWNATRFRAQERNDLSGIAQEDLKMIDIKAYLEYTDIGIGLINPGGTQGYTLRLNFTDESVCSYATVTPASITSLPANSGRTVQVNLSSSSLAIGNTYDSALVLKEGGKEYARIPLRLTVTQNRTTTTSTSTTTSSSTTTNASTSSTTTTITGTAGDANGDGRVGYADLLILAASYGKHAGETGYDERADLDKNGNVGYSDLLIIATNYGRM